APATAAHWHRTPWLSRLSEPAPAETYPLSLTTLFRSLVATVTTGKEGKVDEVKFSPTRTQATYDFLAVSHDGTTGEVTITLPLRSEEHTSELQSRFDLVCRLLLEKKNASGRRGSTRTS